MVVWANQEEIVLRALVTVSIQVVVSVFAQFVPRDQGTVVGYRDSTTSTSKEVLTFVLNLNLTYCSVLLQDFLGMTMNKPCKQGPST